MDEYKEFYDHLGDCLAQGVRVELLRFFTSRFGLERISLKEYVKGISLNRSGKEQKD